MRLDLTQEHLFLARLRNRIEQGTRPSNPEEQLAIIEEIERIRDLLESGVETEEVGKPNHLADKLNAWRK